MFKVNSKDSRTMPLASFWYLHCSLWTYFTPCSSVSIVNFKHVIAGWDAVTAFRPKDFKVFPNFLRFIYFLSKIIFTELYFLFPSKILNSILNFFVIFFIGVKLWLFKTLKTIFREHGSIYYSAKPFLHISLNPNLPAWSNFMDNFHKLFKKISVCRIYTRNLFIIWEIDLLQFFDKHINCAVLKGS